MHDGVTYQSKRAARLARQLVLLKHTAARGAMALLERLSRTGAIGRDERERQTKSLIDVEILRFFRGDCC